MLLSSLSRAASRSGTRAFSSTRVARSDVAKLTLIGRLASEPEVRKTRSDKEYATYIVGTNNYPPVKSEDGSTQNTVSWHRVLCFQPNAINYVRSLEKGSLVYVEANYEVKEPAQDAEAGSPESQRRIFLRQDVIRVLKKPAPRSDS